MLSIALFPVALLCGVLLTTQVGSNSILARALGNPYASAAVNIRDFAPKILSPRSACEA